MNLKYINGDLFSHIGLDSRDKHIIIPHVCNSVGKWGLGFAKSLSNYSGKPEMRYRRMYDMGNCKLGDIQFVPIDDRCSVVNMIAQNGVRCSIYDKGRYVDYDKLDFCMTSLRHYLDGIQKISGSSFRFEIHAPLFGCGLAGGEWEVVESLIGNIWIKSGIPVTIYYIKDESFYKNQYLLQAIEKQDKMNAC